MIKSREYDPYNQRAIILDREMADELNSVCADLLRIMIKRKKDEENKANGRAMSAFIQAYREAIKPEYT